MKSRTEIIAQREDYESRAIGAFIGLAVGDAVGDLGRDQDYRNRYGLVMRLFEDGKAPMIQNSAYSRRARCSMLMESSHRKRPRKRGVSTF